MSKKQKLEWKDMTTDERLDVMNKHDTWYRSACEICKLIVSLPFLILILSEQKWKYNLYRKFLKTRKVRTENYSHDYPLVLDEQFKVPFNIKWISFDFVELEK